MQVFKSRPDYAGPDNDAYSLKMKSENEASLLRLCIEVGGEEIIEHLRKRTSVAGVSQETALVLEEEIKTLQSMMEEAKELPPLNWEE